MAIALTPPAPRQELEELYSLLGSNGAVGRFVGRKREQISRWRKGGVELRPDSIELVDGAWQAICLINHLVAEEQLPAALHQQWSLLQGQTPAGLFQDRPADLLETLRAAVEGEEAVVVTTAATNTGDALDEEISEWFATNLVPNATVPAPVFAVADDEDDDELPVPPPRLDDSWRGGRSASSDRWF
jgi:hypothetical protein